ncbi:MAG TPA: response regulator [Candidatus Saccharimonadales bacterium]|nr:response regulator [Candidatus Saccharimonadales bacterium]
MEQNQTGEKTILIVEDDTFMGSLLERKFKQKNFQILRAMNVDEARKFIESGPVSLILLDIILPGTDGITFLKELKLNPQFKDIPVIITSNLGKEEEIEKGIAEGATDYIVKAHTTPGEIVEKVEKILGI